MDTIPGKNLATQITGLVDPIQGVRKIDEIHAHRFGPYLVANITICVDGNLTVTEGDKIATRVEDTLMDNIEFMRKVHVHYHPINFDPFTTRHSCTTRADTCRESKNN
jgi:divalent metal cation (Fe/Co/Zn/Cd) transporter